jgi:hypothetical protein
LLKKYNFASIRKSHALLVASKVIGLEANAEKTMFISRECDAGQYHNRKIGNKYLESLEYFKYL